MRLPESLVVGVKKKMVEMVVVMMVMMLLRCGRRRIYICSIPRHSYPSFIFKTSHRPISLVQR